ncbi:MAG: hypothetical protein M1824_001803 [Vezdaea acicularis]|nr:MAG: hypothetical protein M1824_001803 [Vezdaea acicularis]
MALSMWSKPLAANFIRGFKELRKLTEEQESFENTLDLSDDDPVLVGRMLNYFYKVDYDEEWHEGEERWGDDYEERQDTVGISVEALRGPSDAVAEEAAAAAPEEEPAPEEAPANEEEPVSEEAPAPEAEPAPEEAPAPEETPATGETPTPEDYADVSYVALEENEPEIESSITEPGQRPASPVPTILPACLLLHSRMYMIADKYDISSLCELALTRFKVALSHHWSSLDFCECIHEIYSCAEQSNSELREAVVKSAQRYIFRLYKKPSFRKLLTEEKEFLFDVFLRHIQKTKKLWEDTTSEPSGDEP